MFQLSLEQKWIRFTRCSPNSPGQLLGEPTWIWLTINISNLKVPLCTSHMYRRGNRTMLWSTAVSWGHHVLPLVFSSVLRASENDLLPWTLLLCSREMCYKTIQALRDHSPELFSCSCNMKKQETMEKCVRIQSRIANNTCLGKHMSQ